MQRCVKEAIELRDSVNAGMATLPPIAPITAEYLSVRLSMPYIVASGLIDEVNSLGLSESGRYGFFMGLQFAVETIDEIANSREPVDDQ
jgi:hypothetical protein